MIARLLTAVLFTQVFWTAVAAQELTPQQRQAKLAREAAIALRVHAVPNAEREAVLAARMSELMRNERMPLAIWLQYEPWLKAVMVTGATSLAALTAMAWLAARPIRGASRA